jgi:hypothetical protein
MGITPQIYAKARSEIIALFRWDADILSPDQMLRLDCAVALRLALDDLQGRVIRGESIDMARMLTASEALARLLPPAVLASPPPEHREDPREALLEMIMQMRERGEIADRAEEPTLRERIVALEVALAAKDAELAALRAGAPSPGSPPAPAGGNVVPLPRGAPAWAAPAPAAPAYDYDANTEWKSYVNSDASIRSTPRGGGHDWGPV